ncbi:MULTISPECIES: ASCH/PUA domain-containing protein [Hymenobacter]|nr:MULTISPECIES: ASCH/PUA domain-containing protein [Hymenobacter]
MKSTSFLYSTNTTGATPHYHELKVWPDCFAALQAGVKPFDVRENDRDFQVGDALLLREYEPEQERYTGGTVERWVSYLVHGGAFGIEPGWCVLGLAEHPPLPSGISDTRLW